MTMKKHLLLTVTILFFGFTATATPYKGGKQPKGVVQKGLRSITEDAARAHVYFLADDLLEGRQAGHRGSRLASLYIVSQMRQLGISPRTAATCSSSKPVPSLCSIACRAIMWRQTPWRR